jgi:hypothetical protein
MSHERLIEVRVEEARRHILIADLFENTWAAYVARGSER